MADVIPTTSALQTAVETTAMAAEIPQVFCDTSIDLLIDDFHPCTQPINLSCIDLPLISRKHGMHFVFHFSFPSFFKAPNFSGT
jgi:hypothetical protein